MEHLVYVAYFVKKTDRCSHLGCVKCNFFCFLSVSIAFAAIDYNHYRDIFLFPCDYCEKSFQCFLHWLNCLLLQHRLCSSALSEFCCWWMPWYVFIILGSSCPLAERDCVWIPRKPGMSSSMIHADSIVLQQWTNPSFSASAQLHCWTSAPSQPGRHSGTTAGRSNVKVKRKAWGSGRKLKAHGRVRALISRVQPGKNMARVQFSQGPSMRVLWLQAVPRIRRWESPIKISQQTFADNCLQKLLPALLSSPALTS